METSSGMTARALITLAFLILVPLAAVFGTRFTGGVSNAKQSAPEASHATPAAKTVAPAVKPAGPGTLAQNGTAAIPTTPSATNVVPGSNIVAGAKPEVAQQNNQTQPISTSLTSTIQPNPQTVGQRTAMWNPGQIEFPRPTPGSTQHNNVQSASQPSPQTNKVPPTDAATTEPFTWMQGRLRELGAIYYRLENGGPKGEMFRFQCQMAVPGSPSSVQPFEAIEGDPLKAMQKVLQQVEVWHSKLAR